jgi:hypothetical protein
MRVDVAGPMFEAVADFDDVFEALLLHRNGPTPELQQEELLPCLRFFARLLSTGILTLDPDTSFAYGGVAVATLEDFAAGLPAAEMGALPASIHQSLLYLIGPISGLAKRRLQTPQ